MKAEPINIIWDYLNPVWIFGPILDKELRVSSRKKKNYFLRSVYIILLCLFILFVSLTSIITVRTPNSPLYQASRSAEIGRLITIVIVWFQFIISQILAMVMLSSSISDEIRTGSLNVLMTTPVNSFQIVTGKFFSKLLQIFLLLAISLPLLAIIRVFGGISWDYVVLSLCVTISALIFTGSLSLFLSIFYRQAYSVIVLETIIYLFIFAFLPILSAGVGLGYTSTIRDTLISTNPFWVLFVATQTMFPGSTPAYFWGINCLYLLCLSGIILGISVWKVRYAALRSFSVIHKNNESKKVIRNEKGEEVAHYYEYKGNIKRVIGAPIIWKEMYNGFLGEGWTSKFIYIVIALALILSAIQAFRYYNISRIAPLQISSFVRLAIYFIMILRLAAASASSIAREKEGRTLSMLLVSPIDDKDIIRGKVKAAILKNIPLFILYLIPTFITLMSHNSVNFFLKLIQVPLSIISLAASVFFVSCCGVYHGVRSKSSTTAIVNTILTYIVIIYGGFGLINVLFNMFFVLLYRPTGFSRYISWYSLIMSFVYILIVGSLGLLYLRKAERNLRKNIF